MFSGIQLQPLYYAGAAPLITIILMQVHYHHTTHSVTRYN